MYTNADHEGRPELKDSLGALGLQNQGTMECRVNTVLAMLPCRSLLGLANLWPVP